MSLRITPSPSHPTSTTNLSTKTSSNSFSPALSAPSAPGVYDTLRANLSPFPPSESHLQSTHPLESRLARWRSTQAELKMEGLRRTFGIGEPVRRGMELKIAREGEWRPAVLGGSAGVSSDILEGRDERIDWEDVYSGDETRERADFHSEMEGKLKMNW